ncbi:DUF5959 family protein [Kitasatospora sp. NPDC059577]|uniref:DUF5959 family protein n=1 Tax=unclassified Kitasatospora TaxID=2633591 RepID=UPI0036AE68FE
MSDADAVDLIHLEDADGDHCTVRVTGPFRPNGPTGHEVLRAEVLAHTDFLDARLEFHLDRRDLDAWQDALDGLAAGRGAVIGGDRGLSMALQPQEDRSLAVTIDDPDRLTTMLWILPPEDWADDHRDRLERLRRTWPGNVPGRATVTGEGHRGG